MMIFVFGAAVLGMLILGGTGLAAICHIMTTWETLEPEKKRAYIWEVVVVVALIIVGVFSIKALPSIVSDISAATRNFVSGAAATFFLL